MVTRQAIRIAASRDLWLDNVYIKQHIEETDYIPDIVNFECTSLWLTNVTLISDGCDMKGHFNKALFGHFNKAMFVFAAGA